MPTTEAKNELAAVTQKIISEPINTASLKNTIDSFKLLLEKITGLDQEAEVNSQNINLPTGKAIGPKWAGMCLEDAIRTYKFIRGINEGVKNSLKKNPGKPVTILYAGTGPYATLILPLLSLYKPTEVQFILLEVNTISIESLKRVIKSFDAYDYVKAIYHCDAANFIIPAELDADILLVECLQHGLLREPQVGITYNLLSQLKKDVVVIPEEISLHVSLIDIEKKNDYLSIEDNTNERDYYVNSEAVFTLNKEEVHKNNIKITEEGYLFPEKETQFTAEQLSAYDLIAISTEITIFEAIIINIDESGLTTPMYLADLNRDQAVIGAKTQYKVGLDPGLEVQLVRTKSKAII